MELNFYFHKLEMKLYNNKLSSEDNKVKCNFNKKILKKYNL